jgi:glutathione synthase/RimK-type ligase-like ATP-grasp enzyme
MTNLTIAIHHLSGNDSYSDKWIEYCNEHKINYKLVDCYDSEILQELKGCDALMWHWQHTDYKAQLFARQLMLSLETIGFRVFPNARTSWHFDDKLGQKYLLEAIDAPMVKSHAFYDKATATRWLQETSLPKVFKLRNGAGAHNVQLIKTQTEAKRYINKVFSRGFKSNHRGAVLDEKIWHFKRDKSLKSFLNIGKGIFRFFFPHTIRKKLSIEKNYLYAQDFIPNCDHDIRVFVIGNRAVTKKRMVREGDFRASGSGKMSWDIGKEGKACVKMAFEVTQKLQAQSLAFDFVLDKDEYKIVEISYAASPRGFPETPGYWDSHLNWIETPLRVEYFMMEDMIQSLGSKP